MVKLKDGFTGERALVLPRIIVDKMEEAPLPSMLHITDIGYYPKAKHHFRERKEPINQYVFIYCIDGAGSYRIGDQEYTVSANQYFILPAGVPHSYASNKSTPWTIYWLHFQGKLRDQFLPSHPVPVTISPNEYSRLQDRLRLFEEIYSSFSMGYIKEYMIYSSMCLYNFLASFIYLEQFRHIMIPSQKEYPFTARVIHFMRENIQQNLTLKELASYFKYSPSHFSALFFGETGVSPMNYFIRLKIQKACEYIELTNMKLNEIATHLGFEDAAYFSRTFTKVMGCSPSVYRKKEMEI